MKSPFSIRLAALLCGVVLATPAFAGQDDFDKLSLEDLLKLSIPTVTTASRRAERADESPATVVVVTAQDIRLRGYRYLNDVLRDLPGMETAEYTIAEYGTRAAVRGIGGNNKIVILYDGVRVNPAGGEPAILRSDFTLEEVEQVEIIYGPGSTLYGQDAIGAVINVVPKKQLGDHVTATGGGGYPSRGFGQLSFSKDVGIGMLSGFAHYGRATLTDFSKEYPAWWAVDALAASTRPDPAPPHRYDNGFNAGARLDLGHTQIQIWHRESARSSADGITTGLGFTSAANWNDRSTVIEARNTARFENGVELESTIDVNRYEVLPRSRFIYALPTNPTAWTQDQRYASSLGVHAEEKIFAQLADRLWLTAGLSVAAIDDLPLMQITDQFDPSRDAVSQATAYTYFTRKGDPSSAVTVSTGNLLSYQTAGVYAEATWRIANPLKIIVGARIDGSTRYSDKPISPRASVVFNFSKELAIKYIFTGAYVAPPPYQNVTFFGGTFLNVPNNDLRPERAWSNEVNLAWNSKRISASASAYYNRQNDLLFAGATAANQVPGSTAWLDPGGNYPLVLNQTVNYGRTYSYGTDLLLKASAGRVSGWASYSYTNVVALGAETDAAPYGYSHHNYRLGVTYGILSDLYATASLVARSRPIGIVSLAGIDPNDLTLPHEVNLNVVYNPSRSLELFAQARNLTNHHYALANWDGGSVAMAETMSAMVGMKFTH